MGKIGHVYALVEAPEEELAKLARDGVLAGQTMDDLSRMSVGEMRALIRKLRDDVGAVVKEETKALKAENRSLVKELDTLKSQVQGIPDAEWAEELTGEIDGAYEEFDAALRALAFDERILEAPEVQAVVEGTISKMLKRVKGLDKQWSEFTAA